MSHVATLALQFLSLEDLEAAVVQVPDAAFNRGKTTHRYYSGTKACLHEITVKGFNYSIGVVKHSSGNGFDLAVDNFGGAKGQTHDGRGLVAHFGGANLPLIARNYSDQVSVGQLRKEGWRVFREQQADGGIRLRATR